MDPFAGKPSKEQLEYYFKTSRAYFDQIARQYSESTSDFDKEYYNKMIAPFYGPFSGINSNAAGGSSLAAKASIAFGAVCMILFIGGILFYFLNLDIPNDPEDQEPLSESVTTYETTYTYSNKDVKIEQEGTTEGTDKTASKTPENMSNYELGEKYFNEQNWDKAEEHYKLVTPEDKHYMEVSIKLMAIKQIKEVQNSTGVKITPPPNK